MTKFVLNGAALAVVAAGALVSGCATETGTTAQTGPKVEEVREYATGSRLPVRKLGPQEPAKAAGDTPAPAPAKG